jgi:hypothetical protein
MERNYKKQTAAETQHRRVLTEGPARYFVDDDDGSMSSDEIDPQ